MIFNSYLNQKRLMCLKNIDVKFNRGYGTRQNFSVTQGQRKIFFVTKNIIIKKKLVTIY